MPRPHLLLAACALLAPLVVAQEADWPENDNAALYYWRAIYFKPDAADDEEAEAALWDDLVDVLDGAAVYDPDRFDEFLDRYADSLREVERGSRIEGCDFGHHWADGPEMVLPHLASARELAQMLALDGKRAEAAGDVGRAVDRYETVLRFAHHIAADRILIDVLVGDAMQRVALEALVDLVDRSPEGIDLEAIGRLLDAEQALLPDFAGSLAIEKRMMGGWFRSIDPDRAIEAFSMLGMAGDENDPEKDPYEAWARELGTTAERLRDPAFWTEGVTAYEEAMDEMAVAFARPLPGRRAAIEAVEDEALGDEGHPLVKMLIPAVVSLSDRQAIATTRLALARVAVALRAAGDLPETLEGLDLPLDPGSGGPFTCRSEEGALVVESVLVDRDEEPITLRLRR